MNRLDLLYLNSDSENEDELFTLSTSSSLVVGPTDLPPGGQNEVGGDARGQDEGEDKLSMLRAELESCVSGKNEEGGVEGGGGECEDGGRCVTQLLHLVGMEEKGEEGGGECGYGGSFGGTEEGEDGGGGWCVDGGRLTQLHVLREEEEEEDGETAAKDQPDRPNLAREGSSNDQRLQRDVPDGGMFSRPPPPPQEPEEEEEVVFSSLVPLSCRCYYGREEEMKSLKSTAEPVLEQAVALVHSSLGQWRLYLVPTTCSVRTLFNAHHLLIRKLRMLVTF